MVADGAHKRSVNVLVLAPSVDLLGGAEKHAHRLAVLLPQENLSIHLVTPNHLGLAATEEGLGLRITRVRIPLLMLPYVETLSSFPRGGKEYGRFRVSMARLAYLTWLLWTFWRYGRRKEIDVIHAHTTIIPALAALLSGRRFVVTLHGGEMARVASGARVARWANRSILRRACCVIAVSQESYNRAHDLGVPPERLRLIPNGVDCDRWAAPPKGRQTPRSERVRLLFAGRLEHVKGPDVLLRAISLVSADRAMHLEIAGAGNLMDSLREQASVCPHQVTFLGRLSEAELIRTLHRCDIVVIPSRSEGLPLFLLEAMAAGKPVVATRVGAIPDVLDSDAILTPPGDAEALASAVERLVADPALRDKLSKANLALSARFDWRRIAAETAEALRKCTNCRE